MDYYIKKDFTFKEFIDILESDYLDKKIFVDHHFTLQFSESFLDLERYTNKNNIR